MISRSFLCSLAIILTLAACSRSPEERKQHFLELGNEYHEAEKYEEASLLYRKALQEDRRSSEVYYRLGLTSLKLNALQAALNAFVRAFELDRDNLDAFSYLSEMHLVALSVPQPIASKETMDSLLRIHDEAALRHPASFEVKYVEGRILLRQAKWEEGARVLEEALRARPGNAKAVLALATARMRSDSPEEAERLVLGLLENDDESFETASKILYLLYFSQRKIEKAERIVRMKCERMPDRLGNWLELAAHYRGVGELDQAEETISGLVGRIDEFPNVHEHVGNYYLLSKQIDKAMASYRRGLEAEPDRAREYHLRMVDAYLAGNEQEMANLELETLLEIDPNDSLARGMRGVLGLMSRDPELRASALEDLREAVRFNPGNHLLRYHYGRALLSSGDITNAKVQLREALKTNPGFRESIYTMIDIHNTEREFTQAEVLASSMIEDHPNDVNARLGRAIALIGLQEYAAARPELEILLRTKLRTADILYQLGRLETFEKNYSAATKYFRELSEGPPPDARGSQGLLNVMLLRRDIDGARVFVEDHVAQSPDNMTLRLAAVNLAILSGDLDQAEKHLKPVLDKDAMHGEANYQLARVRQLQNNRESAKKHLLIALNSTPPIPAAMFEYGTILAQEGLLQEARPQLERCVRLQPDHARALNNLAFVLAELGVELDAAITYSQRAMARAPNNPDFADTLGYVYIKRELNQNAIDILTGIVQQHPARGDFQYHLGLAHYQAGDRAKALRHLNVASDAEELSPPQRDQVRQLLSELGG